MVKLPIVQQAQRTQRWWGEMRDRRGQSSVVVRGGRPGTRADQLGATVGAPACGLSTIAACLLLPLAVACSSEAGGGADDSVETWDESATESLLVRPFEPDPAMFFGESAEEQERARDLLDAEFSDDALVDKTVDTARCIEFTVPPFIGPGGVQSFENTLPQGGVTPTDACGTGAGLSRRVTIQNFSTITRPGSGNLFVGVRNASVAECVDLRVALSVTEQRSQGTRVIFRSGDERAVLRQRADGTTGCASYVNMIGTTGYENRDLWIAVQAKVNGAIINDRVHLIRGSDL